MSLSPGTRLGPYEVTAQIGAGGMGEVYRARDTRLDRTVAIKVLPSEVAGDPELRARFEREARAVAALDHPHICGIYDVGDASGMHFIVMPHLEGQTLARRLEKGPLPLDQALTIATEIADALDKAHRHGIVHRDLKPANIMLTNTGSKLLDFGLAKFKAPSAAISMSGMTRLATSTPGTAQGTILGTVQYMAPEQVEGEQADARSDIWALGAVIYEMVTGTRPFQGETPASVIGSILKDQPALISSRLPSIPTLLDRVLARCLAKDANDRWQSAADLRQALMWIADGLTGTNVSPTTRQAGRASLAGGRERLLGVAAGLAILASLAMVVPTIRYFRPASPRPGPAELRLEVTTPPTTDPISMALSPDGRRLVFVALDNGTPRLWLRPLDTETAQPLPGTDGASYPFWSPDSRAIGFGAGGRLKRIDIGGGQPQEVTAVAGFRGGAWSADDVILFASLASGLRRVAAKGGDVTVATQTSQRQTNHRFPQFLPDGRHFIFFSQGSNEVRGVYLGTLDSTEFTRLTTADAAAGYMPPGYLFYVRQGSLVARRLDLPAGILKDDTITVADRIGWDGALGIGAFSISTAGIIAYRISGPGRRQLAWFDRTGRLAGTVGSSDPNSLQYPELSRNGRQVATDRTVLSNRDIYVMDLARREPAPARLTFDASNEFAAVWSPDGSRLVFRSDRKGVADLYQQSSTLKGVETVLYESSDPKTPNSWSPDGHSIIFVNQGMQTGNDLWVLTIGDSSEHSKPMPIIQTPSDESQAAFSPNGAWVAYQSNEGGPVEVYVQPFPPTGGKKQVSIAGGGSPRWRHDGQELFYVSPEGKIMAVPIHIEGSTLESGTAAALFQPPLSGSTFTGIAGNVRPQYDVAPDGRFLMNVATEETISPIIVVLNWQEELKQR